MTEKKTGKVVLKGKNPPQMIRVRLKRAKNYTYMVPGTGKALTFQGDRDYSLDTKTAELMLEKEDMFGVVVFVKAEDDDKEKAAARAKAKKRKLRRRGSARVLMDVEPDVVDIKKMKVVEHEVHEPEKDLPKGEVVFGGEEDPNEGIPDDLEIE